MSKNLTKPFILILVFLVLVALYFVFKPFLTEILIAAILVSIFYTPYLKFSKFLGGHKRLAAVLMVLLLLVIIILPTVEFISYAGGRSIVAYNSAVNFFNEHTINDFFNSSFFHQGSLKYLNLGKYDFNNHTFQDTILVLLKQSSNWLISGAGSVVKGATNFVISLTLILITMYFFFVDGKKMLKKLMDLMPWPQKYNHELFNKFRVVSRSIFLSSFAAALAQGIVGAIGFAIVGFPALLAGVLVALFSLLPIGSAIFWVPMAIFYLLVGDIWQGIFIILWGALIIGTIDNFVRAYMIKDGAEVNPIFILLAIFGGIILFGFWGVVLGPLLVALAVTIFHIYEMEFKENLSKNLDKKPKEIKA